MHIITLKSDKKRERICWLIVMLLIWILFCNTTLVELSNHPHILYSQILGVISFQFTAPTGTWLLLVIFCYVSSESCNNFLDKGSNLSEWFYKYTLSHCTLGKWCWQETLHCQQAGDNLVLSGLTFDLWVMGSSYSEA